MRTGGITEYVRESRASGVPTPEAYHRLCNADEHRIYFPDGHLGVRQVGKTCEAKIVWDHGYGELILDRAPYAELLPQILAVTRFGPACGPSYNEGLPELPVVHFDTDDSFRAAVVHGEMRLKDFLGQRILLFVPRAASAALRVLFVLPDELESFERNVQVQGSQWSAGRYVAVHFRGRLHKLRVSNFPGELGFCSLDEVTRLVLVPHALPSGDRPAELALQLTHRQSVTPLGTFPIDQDLSPDGPTQVLWSDAPTASSTTWRAAPGVARAPARPRSAARSVPGTTERVEPVHPAVVWAVGRYASELAERPGITKGLRGLIGLPADGEEIAPLQRAVMRGANVRGRGIALQRGLELAGDFRSPWHIRTFYYLLEILKKDGILFRACEDSTEHEFPFEEFRDLGSPATERLCAWFGHSIASLIAEWETTAKQDAERERVQPSASPPAGPPPPPASHTSAGSAPDLGPSLAGRGTHTNGDNPARPPDPVPASSPSQRHPPASPPPGAAFGPEETGSVSSVQDNPLKPEYRRFRPRYPSADGDIKDIEDLDDPGDGSARGPPRGP